MTTFYMANEVFVPNLLGGLGGSHPYKGSIAFNPWHVYTSMVWVDAVTLLLSATGPVKGNGRLNSPAFSLHIANSVFGVASVFTSNAYPTQFGSTGGFVGASGWSADIEPPKTRYSFLAAVTTGVLGVDDEGVEVVPAE